jgi:lysylphosphatidylglycerol synthetase-like protein (DUF2156 family)
MSETTDRTRSRRPLGVAVIAVFLFVDAVVALLQLAGDTPVTTQTQTLLKVSDLAPGGVLLLAALRVVAAVGLWRGSRRAWVLAMVLVGIGLVLSLYLYTLGDPPYVRMLIDVVIAFYLNQGAVRDHFLGRTGQPEPMASPGERPASPEAPVAGARDD